MKTITIFTTTELEPLEKTFNSSFAELLKKVTGKERLYQLDTDGLIKLHDHLIDKENSNEILTAIKVELLKKIKSNDDNIETYKRSLEGYENRKKEYKELQNLLDTSRNPKTLIAKLNLDFNQA